MILLTVGKQLPFDRLSRAVDVLASELEMPVVGQIGETGFRPGNFEAHGNLPATAFEELARSAQVILSHAGIGSILLARRLGKPIVLMPRRAQLGEHRNDHQMATAKQLEGSPGIFVAWEEEELRNAIFAALSSPTTGHAASSSLKDLQRTTAHFIATGDLPKPGEL